MGQAREPYARDVESAQKESDCPRFGRIGTHGVGRPRSDEGVGSAEEEPLGKAGLDQPTRGCESKINQQGVMVSIRTATVEVSRLLLEWRRESGWLSSKFFLLPFSNLPS